jgi:hypothetical protein
MSEFEDEPSFRAWQEALRGVVAAHLALSRARQPAERVSAQEECDKAIATYKGMSEKWATA